MSRMRQSWDEEVQHTLLEQLIRKKYNEGVASLNDRRPFPSMDRQPDLMILDESGEANRYAYLLQPVQVREEMIKNLKQCADDHVDVFVPYDQKEQVESWLTGGDIDIQCIGFRLMCGELQLLS